MYIPNAKNRIVDTILVRNGLRINGKMDPMATDMTFMVVIIRDAHRNRVTRFSLAAKMATSINVYVGY